MTNPRQLYEITSDLTQIPLGLPVLGCLTGFTDAGGTVSQITDSIFASLDTRLLIEFKNDELLDFRSRRPVMFFERDHIISYEPPILGLYLVHDDAGVPFLMLHGYEPDFKWDSFAASVEEIFDLLSVSSFTWVHSIPFPLPHTRPVGITVSGNRQSLIEEHSEWKPSTQVPGNVMHLLEYQLSKSGLPFVGFVLLIPHYLSDSDYPQAALTAFEKITAATGIIFKTDPLREELRAARHVEEHLGAHGHLRVRRVEQDGADLLGAGEALVELHGRAARIGEDRVDTEVLEAADHDVATAHLDAGLGRDGRRGGGGGVLGGVLFGHGLWGGSRPQGMG